MLRYHHNPDAAGAGAAHPLTRMIHIAEKLLPSFDIIEHVAPDINHEEWETPGISPSTAEEVKEQVDERVERVTQFARSFT